MLCYFADLNTHTRTHIMHFAICIHSHVLFQKLLSDNAIFHKLCQIKNNKHILPILAYLKGKTTHYVFILKYVHILIFIVRCTCRNQDCSGFTGYLIMEYFPIGVYVKFFILIHIYYVYTYFEL